MGKTCTRCTKRLKISLTKPTMHWDLNCLSIMFDKSTTSPLVLTSNAQPAILVYSIILLELLKSERGVDNLKDAGYCLALGHSLGEYTALVATEAMVLRDAIKLVHQRGKLMQAAVDSTEYGMFALLRSPYNSVLQLCESVNNTSEQKCDIANHNTGDQVVISGHINAVENVISQGKQNKSIRRAAETRCVCAIPLKVHGTCGFWT